MDTRKILIYSAVGIVSVTLVVAAIRYFGGKSQSIWRYR